LILPTNNQPHTLPEIENCLSPNLLSSFSSLLPVERAKVLIQNLAIFSETQGVVAFGRIRRQFTVVRSLAPAKRSTGPSLGIFSIKP